MITPLYEAVLPPGELRRPTEYERLMTQVALGDVCIGRAAALRIARRIEEQGGFWGPRKVR